MAKRITSKEIIQPDIFKDTISSGESLLKVIVDIEKSFKELGKQAEKTSKETTFEDVEKIEKLQKAYQDTTKAKKQLNDIQKQEQKVLQKIEEIRKGEQDALIKLKIEQSELLKQKKQEIKENEGLVSAYAKQSKKLRDLKNEYKDATLQGSKTTKELDKMRKEIKKLDKELVDLDESVNDSFRNIGKYERAVERLEKDLIKLAAAGAAVGGAFKGMQSSLEASEEGSEELRKATSKLDAILSVSKNTIATAALDLWDFGEAVINGDKSLTDIGDAFEDTSKRLKTFGKDINDATKASETATIAQIRLEKISRELRKEIELLSGEIDKQTAIAGDSTRGFDDIAEANEKALLAERQRAAIFVTIAEQERDIIKNRIEALGNEANSLELKNELAEKEIELIGFKNDLRVAEIELSKEIRVNERDRYEKALDYALDLFDTQKTLNERQISDENNSYTQRVSLFERTKVLADEAFQEQIRLSEEFVGKSLELNELVAIDDQKVIYERISLLTQDEIIQQRLLDIIRDRKTVILDLADAERDLNEELKERNKIDEDFINSKEAIADVEEEETFNLKNYIDERNKKRQEELETIQKFSQLATEYIINQSKKREDALNDEFDANEKRQDQLRQLADEGNKNAIESLDELQKRQADIEREKLAEQRKQRAAELINTGIQTYTAKVQNNDPNPVGGTLTEITLLQEGLKRIGAFYTGTEKNVETDLGSPSLNTSKDAYLGITKSKKLFRFDGKEKIFNPKQSAILDKYGMSNTDVVNMVERFANMDLDKKVDSLNKPYQSNSEIIRKFDEVVKAVKNQKHETTNFNYDNFMKAFIESKRSGNKVVKRIRKTSF